MTDRELLELAAKANGGLVYVNGIGWIHEDDGGDRGAWWNPLADDGDAMRLAIELCISITPYPVYSEPKHSVIVKRRRHGDMMRESNPTEVVESYGLDPSAATRRAIVRAAAEIGKGL